MAFSTSLTNAPNANIAAVVSLPANLTQPNRVSFVQWSYSNTPTNGTLTITDGANTVCKHYITSAGPGYLPFGGNAYGTENAALNITLSAGGANISGALTVIL